MIVVLIVHGYTPLEIIVSHLINIRYVKNAKPIDIYILPNVAFPDLNQMIALIA